MPALPSISPTTASAPASLAARASDASSHTSAFGSHLHAARQRAGRTDDGSAGKPATEERAAVAGAAPAPAGSAARENEPPHASSADDAAPGAGDSRDGGSASSDSPDSSGAASTLAGAMLALLGQTPAAVASRAVAGASKVLTDGSMKGAVAKAGPDADGASTIGADVLAAAQVGADQAAAADAPGADALGAALTAAAATVRDGELSPMLKHAASDDASSKDLAALSAATSAPAPVAPAAPPHTLQVPSPAGTTAFAQELGQQIAWLGGQDIKQARIRLHPEDLGQLDLKVSVQHNHQVDVSFAVQNPQAVHALQQTLAQLDAMLAQHGLSLGQADVGQRHGGGQGSAGDSPARLIDGIGDGEPRGAVHVAASGLLDAFA